jgi:hypothetical protein
VNEMRAIGAILVIVGVLLLLHQFNPSLLGPLMAYGPYIREAFWSVTLIAGGLYLLARGILRKLVIILYVTYLLLYLVV